MLVSAYQVNNVLRVYGDQLRQSKLTHRSKSTETPAPDRVTFSAEARKKSIIDSVANNIVQRITQDGPHDNVEKQVFEKLENDYGTHLTVSQNNPNELIFKEIDEKGEAIKSLSIEDSNFLVSKLEQITKETVGQNMI